MNELTSLLQRILFEIGLFILLDTAITLVTHMLGSTAIRTTYQVSNLILQVAKKAIML